MTELHEVVKLKGKKTSGKPTDDAAKYSGPASNDFWRRVNRIKDGRERAMCYELGCAIQDIEYRLLRAMEIAEKGEKPKQ